MVERVLYATPAADRFFVLPVDHDPAAGNLRLVSISGEERRVDAAAVADYEVTPEQAKAHLRTETERALVGVADALALTLSVAGEQPPHLKRLAERIGLADGDRRAAQAMLRGLAADMHAIAAAVASGQPADLETARRRLEARGFDLGGALDDFTRRIEEIRRFNHQDLANAAVSRLRVFNDSVEGDPERSLGRRIDELIARLERDFGPYGGRDPKRNRERRQEEYGRDARSAIADSVRAAGFTPLNEPREGER